MLSVRQLTILFFLCGVQYTASAQLREPASLIKVRLVGHWSVGVIGFDAEPSAMISFAILA